MENQINTLNIIAALTLSAMYTVDVLVLVGLARIQLRTKIIAWAVAVLWGALIVTITTLGGFAPGVLGLVPTPVVAFTVVIVAWITGWYLWPDFRKALESLPLAALIGVNALRLGGVFFLILWSQGQLPAPFAPSAGWGDIITAVVAIPLTLAAAGLLPLSRWFLKLWNVFGALDLIVAVTLAFFSVPNAPWRIFMDPPGTVVLGTLPWIGVATTLVPLYLMTHFVIWKRTAQRFNH